MPKPTRKLKQPGYNPQIPDMIYKREPSVEWVDSERTRVPIRDDKKIFEDVYEGNWLASKRHGDGVEKYGNGDVYTGQFVNGLLHGRGRYDWANGSYYEGMFSLGKKHGTGKLLCRDATAGDDLDELRRRSSVYNGEFDRGVKSGFGTMVWSTGGRYDGQFQNDMRHGQGKMIWGDGTTYEGHWECGCRDGIGYMRWRENERIGMFRRNNFEKDLRFLFDGMRLGVYGEFQES